MIDSTNISVSGLSHRHPPTHDDPFSDPDNPQGLRPDQSPIGAADTTNLVSNGIADQRTIVSQRRRAFWLRSIALLCACSLSVGSHYASNILGPLKSRLHRELGTTHTEFGLLMAAHSLNSTWTPLVGGLMANRLGTTFTSILATGFIFLGQVLLLVGDVMGQVRLMALGLFVFGLGISPLSVIQETIIVRFFKSHGLGVSMAFGLIAGKGASFLAARTSYPLTERFGGRAPFYVATWLTALSVATNLIYLGCSRWLITGAGAELEASDIKDEARRRMASDDMTAAQALEKVAERRYVKFRSIVKLGDVFWAYVWLNVLCGMIWSPFIHLSPNLIERRFGLSEHEGAIQASYLLAGSIVLYPVCGYLVDTAKQRNIILRLLCFASFLTGCGFLWLVMSPLITKTALPGILTYAFGHGFSPLLLVVLVPELVPPKYVSTALGVHKSMEQVGSTLFQTLAGLLLDSQLPKHPQENQEQRTYQHLLNAFFVLNVLQFMSILVLGYLRDSRQPLTMKVATEVPDSTGCLLDGSCASECRICPTDHLTPVASTSQQETQPLLSLSDNSNDHYSSIATSTRLDEDDEESICSPAELERGRWMAFTCFALFTSTWVLFMCTAWLKLGKGK